MDAKKIIVTGAFGYTGKYISQKLIQANYRVATLTNSSRREQNKLFCCETHPFNFDNPDQLVESMIGAEILINTYWIRMQTNQITFELAVQNTKKLITSAIKAGISKIIHISATNANLQSSSKYYRSKAEVEEFIKNSELSYSILRPAFLFGNEDILVNNIAWMLRHLPAYPIFKNGLYRIRPIHVEDLADLVLEQIDNPKNQVINAVGQVTLTYRDFISKIAESIGLFRPLISVPVWFGFFGSRVLSLMLNDVITTREELYALVGESLYAEGPAIGKINLIDWIENNKSVLGKRYHNERNRRRFLDKPYEYL